MYTVEKAAELLNLKPTTIRTWLKEGKLKGTKVGKSWRISENDLREKFPQGTFSSPSKKGITDVSNNNELSKHLYPNSYENHELQNEEIKYDEWTDKMLREYREELEIRFPYPYEHNEIVSYDSGLTRHGGDSEVWDSYYRTKLKEEKVKFDKLFELLKKKYQVKDNDIEEVKRTADNIKLLELSGFGVK